MATQTNHEAAEMRQSLLRSVDESRARDAAKAKRNSDAEATIRKALSRAMKNLNHSRMSEYDVELRAAAVDHLLNALINCDKVQW